MDKIKIGTRFVGEGEPCFIIAEAGVNHNGDLELAKKLIDAAVSAGADAIKFQTYKTDSLVIPDSEKAEYQKKTTGVEDSQYKMLKELEFGMNEFQELSKHAKNKSIIFLSTPFDIPSVDLLEKVGVPAYKISSGDLTAIPLIKYVVKKGKPLILSTGMASMDEVNDAIDAIKEIDCKMLEKTILLHCSSSYPAAIKYVNLKAMNTLHNVFRLSVGYSDHTEGITIPIAAVSLGAHVIEKHFTLDKTLPGPDHKASLEPKELEYMVTNIRNVEAALGDGQKTPNPEELKNKDVARKSIVAKVDIEEGTVITEEMLDIKRPGTGFSAKEMYMILGKVTTQKINKNKIIEEKMFR